MAEGKRTPQDVGDTVILLGERSRRQAPTGRPSGVTREKTERGAREATLPALRAECRHRFEETFGERWTHRWRSELVDFVITMRDGSGNDGDPKSAREEQIDQLERDWKKHQRKIEEAGARIRGALDDIRNALASARKAIRDTHTVATLSDGRLSRYVIQSTKVDDLAKVVRTIDEASPEFTEQPPPWRVPPPPSERAILEARARQVFGEHLGRDLSPRELAFVGILAGIRPDLAPRKVRGRRPVLLTVQDVLEREANVYAAFRGRRRRAKDKR
jgi:hypothetical protein